MSHRFPASRVVSFVAALAGATLLMSCASDLAVTTDVASIELTPPTATLRTGDALALAASLRGADGRALGPTRLVWSSGAPGVATVSSTGVVTAVQPGTARIAVSAMGSSATAAITVVPRPVASLVVTPAQSAVLVGRTTRLTAQPLDAEGNALSGRDITYSSSDASIARVSDDGVITGVSPGAATITARCEGRTALAAVSVGVAPVQSVVVEPTRDTLVIGGSRTFTATVRDGSGALLTGRPITWSSSSVATAIVSATGAVTALEPGTATITATSEGRSGSATLVVVSRLANTVTITPSAFALIEGSSLALQAQVTDAVGNVLADRPITFASDAPAIATVNATGTVNAIAPGTARITASSEGRTGTATVQVLPTPVATLELSPAALALQVGQAQAVSATTRAPGGRVLTGRTITWQSGAPEIATVSADGVVTGVATGQALVVATSEGVTAGLTVTVRVPAVATLVITQTGVLLTPGIGQQLSAVARDAAGNVLTGRTVSWSSSNEQIAFVSSTGLVVGFRAGTTTITATAEGISATTTVTVR